MLYVNYVSTKNYVEICSYSLHSLSKKKKKKESQSKEPESGQGFNLGGQGRSVWKDGTYTGAHLKRGRQLCQDLGRGKC